MFAALFVLVLTTDAGCPSCPRATVPPCHALCQCAFPGHCGHAGCTCKSIRGVRRPPADRWVPFVTNPNYEVYGHEVDGVFRYTASRLKAQPARTSGSRGGVQFVVCRFCGTGQLLYLFPQPCTRCGMFLPKLSAASTGSPCYGGRCTR